MDVSKEDRGVWLNAHLDSQDVPQYGRAAHITKRVGCSNAVAAGWLRGSLPQDMALAIKFADDFHVPLRNWVYACNDGVVSPGSGGIPANRVDYVIKMARKFERDEGELSDEQFVYIVKKLAAERDTERTLSEIGQVIDLFGGRNGSGK